MFPAVAGHKIRNYPACTHHYRYRGCGSWGQTLNTERVTNGIAHRLTEADTGQA